MVQLQARAMNWEKIKAVPIKLERPGGFPPVVVEVDGIASGSWFVHRTIVPAMGASGEYEPTGASWTLTQRPTGRLLAYFRRQSEAKAAAEILDTVPYAEKLRVAKRGRAKLTKDEMADALAHIYGQGGWR